MASTVTPQGTLSARIAHTDDKYLGIDERVALTQRYQDPCPICNQYHIPWCTGNVDYKVEPVDIPPKDGTAISVRIPPEVVPYVNDLRRFIDAMVYKLKVHHKKGRWEDLPIDRAQGLLQDEVRELNEAIEGGNLIEVLTEAADVANFALIIASIATERGK